MKRTARDILKEKGGHMVTISSDATVYQALTVMTQNRVGSIVVVEEEKIVGIWTERDLMFRALEEGFDPKTARLWDNMRQNLVSANVEEQAYQLYDKFLGRRIRHLLRRSRRDPRRASAPPRHNTRQGAASGRCPRSIPRSCAGSRRCSRSFRSGCRRSRPSLRGS